MAQNVTSYLLNISKTISIALPIVGSSWFGHKQLFGPKANAFNISLGKIISKSYGDVPNKRVFDIFQHSWLRKVNATSFNPNTYQHLRISSKWDSNWDRREPRAGALHQKPTDKGVGKMQWTKKEIPTASRHLLLVRHGQYNDKGRNDPEHFLTSLGREQADITGARLATLDLPYTSLTSSTMTRALETAALINHHLPELSHNKDSVLREGLPVIPSPDAVGNWNDKRLFSDGARLESAYRKYFHRADVSQEEDSFEIIVCHANVIRYFICRAMQFPPEGWMRLSLTNCSLTLITIEPNGHVLMEMMGDHGHMPTREYITFS